MKVTEESDPISWPTLGPPPIPDAALQDHFSSAGWKAVRHRESLLNRLPSSIRYKLAAAVATVIVSGEWIRLARPAAAAGRPAPSLPPLRLPLVDCQFAAHSDAAAAITTALSLSLSPLGGQEECFLFRHISRCPARDETGKLTANEKENPWAEQKPTADFLTTPKKSKVLGFMDMPTPGRGRVYQDGVFLGTLGEGSYSVFSAYFLIS